MRSARTNIKAGGTWGIHAAILLGLFVHFEDGDETRCGY
jgi:hypothetical protein